MRLLGKKAFYVSFTALIVLFIIVSFVLSQQSISNKKTQSQLQFSQNLLIINYIQDLEHSYFPARIALAEKEALTNLSAQRTDGTINRNSFNINLLQNIVTDGGFANLHNIIPKNDTINALKNYSYSVLNAPIKVTVLTFAIDNVNMSDSFHVTIKSTMHYRIESGPITWENSIPYTTTLSLNGLSDPDYSSDYNPIVPGFWLINQTSVDSCYLSTIMAYNAASICNGAHDICPAADTSVCNETTTSAP